MAVPSRPQHLAKPKPRRSDTGKKINLRADAKSGDKKTGKFFNGESTRTSRGKFHLAKTILFIRVICVSFSHPFASIRR
jgi:hypothetical protein